MEHFTQALQLAQQAMPLSNPNPRVGCVIVSADGRIIGRGHTQRAGEAHAEIMALPHDTLIIHGRDDQVIPPDNALRLNHLISCSQAHIFGRCGHWVQIEHAARFNRLVGDFLAEN